MFKTRTVAVLLTCAVLCAPTHPRAEPVNVCQEFIKSMDHTDKYVTDKIKKDGIGCLIKPQCCGPTWQAHPECYDPVTRLVKGPWTERKVVGTKCEKQEVIDWTRNFVNSWTKPTYLLSKPLYDSYRTYVDLVSSQGHELPDDVRQGLQKLVGAGAVPFRSVDIESAKWVRSDELAARPLSPSTWGQSNPAITHGHLIVVRPAMADATG